MFRLFSCFVSQEVEKALEHGASVMMVNNWDRVTGKLYPKQAMAVRNMIPDQVQRGATKIFVQLCEIDEDVMAQRQQQSVTQNGSIL